jgi:glycosyltransferase involved in cell wall biosynthesis
LPTLDFVVPGDADQLTGGYIYDRRIIEGLRRRAWQVYLRSVPEGFPFPSRSARQAAAELLAALTQGRLVVIDGLALGSIPEVVRLHSNQLRLVGLVHHPLALETGLDNEQARQLRDSERDALTSVRRVIVTSRATADALADYDVGTERLGVVEPGTERRRPAIGSTDKVLNLLCVASVIPRKGHAVLIEALQRLRDKPWRLFCVGSQHRSSDTVAALRHRIDQTGLTERIHWVGELAPSGLEEWYRKADVFVFPTHYEGYGMALAEALAYGLPIVSTLAGAVPKTVPKDAGVLVSPGDAAAFSEALAVVLDDADYRRSLAEGARRAGRKLPDWDQAAERFETELNKVVAG